MCNHIATVGIKGLRAILWSLVLSLALKAKFLALKLKSLVLTLMCYGGPDTIDWSYILPDDERVIRIATNKQGCCPWPWFLVDKIVVLGPDLGLEG